MSDAHTRLKRLEQLAKPAGDCANGLWATAGELDAILPPGAMHPMPADVNIKPDLSHMLQSHEGRVPQLPDIRNRQRPGENGY